MVKRAKPRDREDRMTEEMLQVATRVVASAGESRVAQSFPLLETLRLFLREQPQPRPDGVSGSLKGKTLRYPVVLTKL